MFSQIMVLTIRKMRGLVSAMVFDAFYWTTPRSETQGSKASAETMDPFARAPILARATILALRSVAASRPANTGLAEH